MCPSLFISSDNAKPFFWGGGGTLAMAFDTIESCLLPASTSLFCYGCVSLVPVARDTHPLEGLCITQFCSCSQRKAMTKRAMEIRSVMYWEHARQLESSAVVVVG